MAAKELSASAGSIKFFAMRFSKPPKEIQMAPPRNPEPEPTRPTWKMLLFLVGAVLMAEAVYHWSDISAYAHLPQIEHSLGLD